VVVGKKRIVDEEGWEGEKEEEESVSPQ